MADRLLQQGKNVKWLCDDVSGGALVKVLSSDLVTNYDPVGATTAYVGKAIAGTATSAALWQVKRLTFAADGGVITKFADGDATFDNIWDNRASLTY